LEERAEQVMLGSEGVGRRRRQGWGRNDPQKVCTCELIYKEIVKIHFTLTKFRIDMLLYSFCCTSILSATNWKYLRYFALL
jgi:hypothetical protein